MLDYLTIIHASQPELLLPFKDKATHWLPEFSHKPSNNIHRPPNDIYRPPNFICTTKDTTIELIKVLIIEKILQYDKVFWINANQKELAICYTFDQAGNFNNFFRVK